LQPADALDEAMPAGGSAIEHRSRGLEWDFTALAATYDFRPDYCASLIHDVLDASGLQPDGWGLDVGAGTGKLTAHLCARGLNVVAVEPNARMRAIGMAKNETRGARWIAARGEALPVADRSMDLISFGSSFNVVRTTAALNECARVLRVDGVWLAVYNHRDLDDPLQKSIESIIHRHIPSFEYGPRRTSPIEELSSHGAFRSFQSSERRFVAEVVAEQWMLAWRSHATLQRQAGTSLSVILGQIGNAIGSAAALSIPYVTRAWVARRSDA
jgi:ubiquinone/menaquinone biosynthesis C-methylase UbiE